MYLIRFAWSNQIRLILTGSLVPKNYCQYSCIVFSEELRAPICRLKQLQWASRGRFQSKVFQLLIFPKKNMFYNPAANLLMNNNLMDIKHDVDLIHLWVEACYKCYFSMARFMEYQQILRSALYENGSFRSHRASFSCMFFNGYAKIIMPSIRSFKMAISRLY